jgi:hypothetical protein
MSIEATLGVDRRARAHAALVALLMAASLVPIWIGARFPSQNGPWYLFIVHVLKELGNPQWNFADFYQVNWRPVPHSLHELLVLAFYSVAPLLTAEKLALTLYALGLPLSVFYFLSVVAPDRMFLGYFSFLAIHNYDFYRGYQDFCISIPLFFLTFALWYRHRHAVGRRQQALLALLSAAIYLAHLFTFALLAGTIAGCRLIETRSLRKAIGSMLSTTWIGWILVGNYVLLVLEHPGGFTVDDTTGVPARTAVENLVRKMFYVTSPAAYVIATLPWLAVVWLGADVLARAIRTRGGTRALASDPMTLMVSGALLIYLVLPYKLLGWHAVNVRLIPFMLLMGLAWGGPAAAGLPSARFRRLVIGIVAVAAVSVYGLLARDVVRINAVLDEYLTGVAHFAPNSRLLPLHLENDPFGQIRPLTRAHEHYHIAKGGANGLSIARYNHLTLVWYRRPRGVMFPRFDPDAPERSLRRIRRSYDYLLVWGGNRAWADALTSSGFSLVHGQGRLQLFSTNAPSQNATVPSRAPDTERPPTGRAGGGS